MPGASKVLQQIANTDVRVESYSYEGEDGHWLYLQPGWQFEGCHAVHEWTVKNTLAAFRSIERCPKGCSGCGWQGEEPEAKQQYAQVIPFRKRS